MGCWGLVIYAMTAATCSGRAREHGGHVQRNVSGQFTVRFYLSAILQKYLDNFDLSIKVIYIMGTLGFSIGTSHSAAAAPNRSENSTGRPLCFLLVGTAVMAIFPNVYVAMVMISTMGIISMSISYCPYALLGQYHEMKEVQIFQSFILESFHLCSAVFILKSVGFLKANLLSLSLLQYIQHSPGNSRRGFGIDCAILSCQVSRCGV